MKKQQKSVQGGYICTRARTKTVFCGAVGASKNTAFWQGCAAVEQISAAKPNTAKARAFPEAADSKKTQATTADNCEQLCFGINIDYHYYCCDM